MNKTPATEGFSHLRGMDELKTLAEKLCLVAENQKRLSLNRIQLPNYLFIEAPGCGVTTHIRLLTDLLYELHLTPFEGDRRYFEWVLDDDAFRERTHSFDRLLDEMTVMAGFHSRFKGVIGLEIDAWQDKTDTPAFTRLLDLAKDCLGEVVFIFIIQERPNGEAGALIRRLISEMPLEVVHCPLPSHDDLALYLGDFLERRSFHFSPDAARMIRKMMPRLTSAKAFDGFQTLDNLADEIVYRFCASDTRASGQDIGPENLMFITEDGGYIERLSNKKYGREGRHIGFRD